MTKLKNSQDKAKTLQEKKDDLLSSVYEKYGTFFAFGQSQFDEQKKEGVIYVSLGYGMISPKETSNEMLRELDKAISKGIELEKLSKSKHEIIKYHLSNYECYYIGDCTEAINHCKAFGYTEDDVLKVYKETYAEYWANQE